MNTNAKVFWNKQMASRAKLGGIIGFYSDELPTSLFRFVGKHPNKLSPTYISNRFCQMSILHHIFDFKFFNTNNTKLVDNFSCKLMDKVISFKRNSLMDASNYLFGSSILRCSFGNFRKFPLSFGKSLFFFFEKMWIGNFLPSRESRKTLNTNINTNNLFRLWQRLRFTFTGKANIPFASGLSNNSAGFYLTHNRAMKFNFNISNLGKMKFIIFNLKPKLRVGYRMITVTFFESWISWFFSILNSPKESLKCVVNSCYNILKNLRINLFKRWPFRFEFRKLSALFNIPNALFLFLPTIATLLKQLVIKPLTFFKPIFKNPNLSFGWINTIFMCFLHIMRYSIKQRKGQVAKI